MSIKNSRAGPELVAMTRGISPDIEKCELTHLSRRPIDLELAGKQHRLYEEALEELGCSIVSLPPEPGLPDSVFIEDTAIVLDEVGVITRPGAVSRRPETGAVAEALGAFRTLEIIHKPGTVDGGDILRLEKILYGGLSERTNAQGLAQLKDIVSRYGYQVRPVQVSGCLHLKSAVTPVGEYMLLLNPDWVDPEIFGSLKIITVHPREPRAANALLVGETVLASKSHPATLAKIESHGLRVRPIDNSELEKAEGGVTCGCLIFHA